MIIAIKGFMGSGKTTISNMFFEKYHFNKINADDIVSKIYNEDIEIIEKIQQEFELNKNNDLKNELKNLLSNQPEKIKELEEIINPKVEEKINQQIKECQTKQINCIIECQNIHELNVEYDYEILAYASKKTLVERIIKRDNRTVEEIDFFLKKQEKSQLKIQKHKQYTINTEENLKIFEQLEKIMEVINGDYNWKNS